MGKMAANDRATRAQFVRVHNLHKGGDQENEFPGLAGLFYDEEPMTPGRFFDFH